MQPLDPGTVAPLRRRLLAGLVDGVVASVLASPFLALRWLRHRRAPSRSGRTVLDLAVVAVGAAYDVLAIAAVGQTAGHRALDIRVVDQSTGARPTLVQSLVRWAVAKLGEALTQLLPPVPDKARQATRAAKALQPEIERLRRQYEGDRQGLNAALQKLYEDSGVNPMDSCLPVLVRTLPALLYGYVVHGFALRGPLHQGLHDRVAGTVLVLADAGSDPVAL